jgi:chitosanase
MKARKRLVLSIGMPVLLVIVLVAAYLLQQRAANGGPRVQGSPTAHGTGPVTRMPLTLFNPQKKEIAMELVSSAENSSLDWKAQYAFIQDIGDGRGYTGGIIGFTSATDDMLQLVEYYTQLAPNNILAKYIPALQIVDGTASHAGLDPNFVHDWKTAAKDPLFQQAQEYERDSMYFTPAVNQALADGLHVLGQFMYYDAIVMHGPGNGPSSFGGIHQAAKSQAKTPAQGGNEVTYLNAFLDARRLVMRQEAAHRDTSRLDTEQRVFLEQGNLDLNPPLTWQVNDQRFSIGTSHSIPMPSHSITVSVILYGFDDNSPPNADIAYPKDDGYPTVHNQATEGKGTYNDPITFATDEHELAVGSLVYVPYLEKYFIMEDDCTECDSRWSNQHKYEIALWIGPQSSSPASVLSACEDRLTRDSTTIVVNPASNLRVDTTSLFTHGTCTAHMLT